MKESSGKTKKQSKGVRRARSMRNVVMMVLICVLMLSAATYAWFTISTAAKVANLSMTVGEETSLLIAPDLKRGDSTGGQAGTYGSALNFGATIDDDESIAKYEIDCALLPATLEGTTIEYPFYNTEDGTVIDEFKTVKNEILYDTTFANDASNNSGKYYCYKTTFYLKTAGSSTVTVGLKELPDDNGMTATSAPTSGSGTYIINNGDGMGAAAIRIRLTANTNDEIVYEPLWDVKLKENVAYESATVKQGVDEPTPLTSNVTQKSDGTFESNSGTLEISPDGTRVTMEVWVEGTDDQCVNQIMGNSITGVLAFEVVKTTN